MSSATLQTITFKDADSQNEATLIVRVMGQVVGISTVVVGGGESEIYMPLDACERLHDALAEALASAR
jgi:hypothetical protein